MPILRRIRYLLGALRLLASVALVSICALAACQGRVLLVPLDSRPAVSQFPQLIGKIGGIRVDQPPTPYLGRFTTPGKPELIENWLRSRDLSTCTGLIVSADMIAYGGLIASRVPNVAAADALANLEMLKRIRSKKPNLPIYVFSSLMRTAPTATEETRSYRANLARFAELRERLDRTQDASLKFEINRLRGLIPKIEVAKYDSARERNMRIHEALIRYVSAGVIDYLVIGADDAQAYGPHHPEMKRLRNQAQAAGIAGKVYFCEGVDQHANLLVSRMLLRASGWTPKVFVKLSDPKAASRRAAFESTPLGRSIEDQIIASGGRPTLRSEESDYTLYLNTPGGDTDGGFSMSLIGDVPLAVADINLAKGHADTKLIESLETNRTASSLLGFAGWNTAGNTIGTTVPHANVYLLAKRSGLAELDRELAHRSFLLHRIVNDYGYHRFIRPVAYKMMDGDPKASREEAYGESFKAMESWVVRNTRSMLDDMFHRQFFGTTFSAGGETYRITGLKDVNVELPWPRAFEVYISFELTAKKSTTDSGGIQ
jgi:hypothetical protein